MTAPNADTTIPSGDGGISVPVMEWGAVSNYVRKNWDPENNPHHSVVGLTGSGKTFLIVNGILKPMCPMDRVVIFDSKGGSDKSLTDSPALPCTELPRNTWGRGRLGRKKEPFDAWHRVVLSDNDAKARVQVASTLNRVWSEGEWVVVFDELRSITASRSPGLGLEGPVNRLYTMGRSKHISLIAGTQSPVWVPHTFFDQASFAWFGRIRDETRQKRLLEVGGMTKKELPFIAALQRRHWLLAADNGDFFARTTVTI